MRKIFLLINLLLLCLLNLMAYAFDSKYVVHTSAKEIEYKKKKALSWHKENIEDVKVKTESKELILTHDPKKEMEFLKSKALRWYEGIKSSNEMEFSKKKALRWHANNSQ